MIKSKLKSMLGSVKKVKGWHIQTVAMTCAIITCFSVPALAAGNTYTSNLKTWALSGIQDIAFVGTAAMAVKDLIKRKFIQFVTFLVLASLILVVIISPDKVSTIGSSIWKTIFG